MNQHSRRTAERSANYAKLRRDVLGRSHVLDASPIRKVIDLRTGKTRTRLESVRLAWKARQDGDAA